MSSWGDHSVEKSWSKVSKWQKIFRARMMKFGGQIFFTRGHHSGPRTLAGSWDPPGSFHERPVIKFRLLVFIFFWPENEKTIMDFRFDASTGPLF